MIKEIDLGQGKPPIGLQTEYYKYDHFPLEGGEPFDLFEKEQMMYQRSSHGGGMSRTIQPEEYLLDTLRRMFSGFGKRYLDLPRRTEEAYRRTLDTAIDNLAPFMTEDDRRLNERLFLTLQRVFSALHYQPSENSTLVELGIGPAPYIPAIQSAFRPASYVGIDQDNYYISQAMSKTAYARSENLKLILADAHDPYRLPNFYPENIDTILALNPDIADVEAEREAEERGEFQEPGIIADPHMMGLLYNWHQTLTPNGIMIITTYYDVEAREIIRDQRLAPYVDLYGITGIYLEGSGHPNAYVVALKAEPRPRNQEPIIWRRENYREYQENEAGMYYPNI